MTGPDFDHFCRLVRSRSGLVLTPEKSYLVRSRLAEVARAEGLADVPALLARIKAGASETMIRRCVDAMATHESSFFRDGAPFSEMTANILPPLIEARHASRRLKIWCAACSSGQEPYSLAIALQEMGARLAGWQIEILATDMSVSILKKAESGLYSDFEVKRGLSPERLARWFTASGGSWQVAPLLRQMVQFRPHNLLESPPAGGPFDIVLCRNVLIYFDVEQKRKVLGDIQRVLAPDGSLLLGSAETIIGVTTQFAVKTGARGLYQPVAGAVARVA